MIDRPYYDEEEYEEYEEYKNNYTIGILNDMCNGFWTNNQGDILFIKNINEISYLNNIRAMVIKWVDNTSLFCDDKLLNKAIKVIDKRILELSEIDF